MTTQASFAPPDPKALAEGAQLMTQALGESFKSMAGVSLPADRLSALQSDYLSQASALWNGALSRMQHGGTTALAASKIGDKRFGSPAWSQNPAAEMMAQSYLFSAR